MSDEGMEESERQEITRTLHSERDSLKMKLKTAQEKKVAWLLEVSRDCAKHKVCVVRKSRTQHQVTARDGDPFTTRSQVGPQLDNKPGAHSGGPHPSENPGDSGDNRNHGGETCGEPGGEGTSGGEGTTTLRAQVGTPTGTNTRGAIRVGPTPWLNTMVVRDKQEVMLTQGPRTRMMP